MSSIYHISLTKEEGQVVTLEEYKDKVLLVVNVPVNTGSTAQHKKLEQLYRDYKDMGFEILAVQTDEFDIKLFGDKHQFSFPLFQKTKVRGEGQHELYKILTTDAPDSFGTFYSQAKRAFIMRGLDIGSDNDVMWNFEKFLINKQGVAVKRFAPEIHPDDSRLIEVLDKEIGNISSLSA
jgi:glutathione peroxidase